MSSLCLYMSYLIKAMFFQTSLALIAAAYFLFFTKRYSEKQEIASTNYFTLTKIYNILHRQFS
jgi:hypothetical protein